MTVAQKRKKPTQSVEEREDAPPAEEMANFQLKRLVGHGGYAKVYMARNLTNQQLVAIKVIDKPQILKPEDQKQIQQIKDEVNVLRPIHFPFITQMRQFFENGSKVYIVLEFCQGGNLLNVINEHFKKKTKEMPSEADVKFYVSEIVCALEYLHENNILYRDLKCENIVVDKFGHLKLADFGLSKPNFTRNMTTRSICGTTGFKAPEMSGAYGRPVDIWALGALVHDMITDEPPPLDKNTGAADLPNPIEYACTGKEISGKLQNFIESLLTFEPRDRPDISAVMRLPFLRKSEKDWVKVVQKGFTPPYVPTFKSDVDCKIFGKWGNAVDEAKPAVNYDMLFAGFEFNGEQVEEEAAQEPQIAQENEPDTKKKKKNVRKN